MPIRKTTVGTVTGAETTDDNLRKVAAKREEWTAQDSRELERESTDEDE